MLIFSVSFQFQYMCCRSEHHLSYFNLINRAYHGIFTYSSQPGTEGKVIQHHLSSEMWKKVICSQLQKKLSDGIQGQVNSFFGSQRTSSYQMFTHIFRKSILSMSHSKKDLSRRLLFHNTIKHQSDFTFPFVYEDQYYLYQY